MQSTLMYSEVYMYLYVCMCSLELSLLKVAANSWFGKKAGLVVLFAVKSRDFHPLLLTNSVTKLGEYLSWYIQVKSPFLQIRERLNIWIKGLEEHYRNRKMNKSNFEMKNLLWISKADMSRRSVIDYEPVNLNHCFDLG